MIRKALLTLLSAGPKYGYQLKSEFEASSGAAWALNIGQVYNTVQRMERDGAVVPLGVDDQDRPLYELSPEGRQELDEWLATAVKRSVATRDEVVMKVLMSAATGVTEPSQPISIQRSASMGVLQEATAARVASSSVADIVHLEWLIATTTAELKWLDVTEQILEAGGAVQLQAAMANSGARARGVSAKAKLTDESGRTK